MKSHNIRQVLAVVGAVLIFAAAVLWFVTALGNTDTAQQAQRLTAVQRNIENGVTLCYSIEGAYPISMEYLSENYGITYDKERYLVHYECFAANVRPVIRVVEKG